MTDAGRWNEGRPPPEIKDPIWWQGQWQERGDWMSEHLTESAIHTVVTAWCNVCKRETKRMVYRVAIGSHAGKPGPCLEHGPAWLSADQKKRRDREERSRRQPSLFD